MKIDLLSLCAVPFGLMCALAVIASYPLEWNMPVIVQIVLFVGGVLVAFIPRLSSGLLEGRDVEIGAGGVKIKDQHEEAE